MNPILKGVKDVQNLSNSLYAQNEILQENHAELVEKVDANKILSQSVPRTLVEPRPHRRRLRRRSE